MNETTRPLDDSIPFASFCKDLFLPDGKTRIPEWAERLRCRESQLVNWCLACETPTKAELVRLHKAVMDDGRFPVDLRMRWEAMLPMTMDVLMDILTETEGEIFWTLEDIIERGLYEEFQTNLAKLPMMHRLAHIRRCAEHAETLSHYHKRK